MEFLHNMKLWLSPPKITDPVFGQMIFMHIGKHPERSYWEGRWTLLGFAHVVEVFLRGGEDGPNGDARRFFLTLPGRFEQILESCRPPLASVFRGWLNRDLPDDIFSELKLASVAADDPQMSPLRWSVSFETTGENWLGITVPFVDDAAGDAEVDS
jgi:hypothetical protein